MIRALMIALAAGLTLAAPAAARTLDVDAHVSANFLSSGSTNVLAGTLNDQALGHGALRESSHSEGDESSLTGKARYVDGRGTLSWTEALRTQATSDSTLSVTGTWTAARGTGRYAHAAGKGTVSGTVDTRTGVTHLRYSGTLSHDPERLHVPRRQAHRYHATIHAIGIEIDSDGVATVAGPVEGLTPAGGMLVFRAKQGVPRTKAPFIFYDGRGTLFGYAYIERVQNSDGSTSIIGRGGQFQGGTGRYAHVKARGRAVFGGSRDPDTGVVTLKLRGTLVY